MRLTINKFMRCCLILCLSLQPLLSGCTPQQEAAAVTQFETGLNSLIQNRTLSEEFVRDIKAATDPSDPHYAEAMDSYEDAKRSCDVFLDDVESDSKMSSDRSLRTADPQDVQEATATFVADALSILKPEVNTRHMGIKRAIVIPDDLRATFHRLPKKQRRLIIARFDHQVRWRSWSQL